MSTSRLMLFRTVFHPNTQRTTERRRYVEKLNSVSVDNALKALISTSTRPEIGLGRDL